jgi:hypothetical protein
MRIAAKASKKQKSQQEKDTKTKKSELNSPEADPSKLRAELNDLKKRVASLEKK